MSPNWRNIIIIVAAVLRFFWPVFIVCVAELPFCSGFFLSAAALDGAIGYWEVDVGRAIKMFCFF
jgi:hypothetical protein